MGANSKMYPKKNYDKLHDVTFAEWPKYENETSIQAVAEKIIEQHSIKTNMIVGGSSLGGMVAIQIAKIVGIKKVILIGSATEPKFINPLLKKLRKLSQITPVKFIQILAGKINVAGKNNLLTMFSESDTHFIKAMCKAIFLWEGLGDYECEICHIHGQLDKVIIPPKTNVRIIPGGGHLISMTHSEVVADFIFKNINLH